MKKIKVSELPVSTNLQGLYTLGTDANNQSVKVSLEFVQQKANAAETAAATANTAAANANTARTNANNAASAATTAAATANTAATNANTARDNANTARNNANTAATNANNAATNATQTAAAAVASCADATANAIEAKQQADTAAQNAHTKANAADTAATGARTATNMLLQQYGHFIAPTGLVVEPIPRITFGNTQPVYIVASLLPVQVPQNIIFISDNRAVTVTQDGRLTVVGLGRSTVQIIPTMNTSLYKVVEIEVGMPRLRLVNTRTRLRFTEAGTLRLT